MKHVLMRKMHYIGRGSVEEVRYFLLLSKDLGYIEDGIMVISDPELAKKVIEAIEKDFNVMIF